MKTLAWVGCCLVVVACGGGGTGGTGGGSAGTGGGATGGGSGGGAGGGSGDAGSPMTGFTVTGGLTATIPSSGPIAAYQVSTGLSGVQFATIPVTVNPAVSIGVTRAGQLVAGTLDSSVAGFNCAISVTDNTNVWLTAVAADGGTTLGSCSMNLTSVAVRFTAVDGTSYTVHGTMTAVAKKSGSADVTLNASF